MLVAQVLRKEQLTPQMVRIVLGGDDLNGFEAGEFTDHYVKLLFSFDDDKTRTRTYSVRSWDTEARELTIDFVVHGDEGVAGPWAAAAEPGDSLTLRGGPGGAYAPDPDAPWHLMTGDSAVIPAIAVSLARIPAGVPVHVILAVDGPEEEQPLETEGDLHVTWLHTGGSAEREEELVLEAVTSLEFPAGVPCVFVHGEAGTVRSVRRHLLQDRGVPKEGMSATGYWKRARTEEGWREDKPEWKRLAEQDEARAG